MPGVFAVGMCIYSGSSVLLLANKRIKACPVPETVATPAANGVRSEGWPTRSSSQELAREWWARQGAVGVLCWVLPSRPGLLTEGGELGRCVSTSAEHEARQKCLQIA